jgi:hypothetical protein
MIYIGEARDGYVSIYLCMNERINVYISVYRFTKQYISTNIIGEGYHSKSRKIFEFGKWGFCLVYPYVDRSMEPLQV